MIPFPWETLLDQLEQELTDCEVPGRRAAVCCRLALLHWDVRGDRNSAQHWIGRAELAPAAAELRRQLLLDSGDAAAAATLLEQQASPGAHARGAALSPGGLSPGPSGGEPRSGAERSAQDVTARGRELLMEAGLLWLLWVGDPLRGADCFERCGEDELLEIALGLLGDRDRLAALASRPDPSTFGLLLAVEATSDPTQAFVLLERAAEMDDQDPLILELMLEVCARLRRPARRLQLLQKKLSMLMRHGPPSAEVMGLAFDISRLLNEAGLEEQADALLEMVDPALDDLDPSRPHTPTGEPHSAPDVTAPVNPVSWVTTLLRLARRDQAARGGDSARMEQIYLAMAQATEVPAIARVYRLRAVQLMQWRLFHPPGAAAQPTVDEVHATRQAEQLLRQNLQENPEDQYAARALEQSLLRRGDMEGLCLHYQQQADVHLEAKGDLLYRAAIIAEAHLDNRKLAAGLRRDCLAVGPRGSAHGDLQRLYRAVQSGSRLMEAYQREADTTDDPDVRSLLWSVLSALRLKLGQVDDAESAALEALEAMPDDPLALAVLVSVYDSTDRQAHLRQILQRQADMLTSPVSRAASLLRMATHCDTAEARTLIARANEISPRDRSVLTALMERCEEAGEYEAAVQWGFELAQAVEDSPALAAQAYIHIGRLHEDRLGDSDGAAQAYERALRFEPDALAALERLCDVRRKSSDLEAVIELLRRRIELCPPGDEQAALWLELARAMEKTGAAVDDLVAAYAMAASSSSQRLAAVNELERNCRQANRLQQFVGVMLTLPRELDTLQRLATALTELEHLPALSTVLGDLIDLAADDAVRADRTCDLGRVLEQMGQTDQAVAHYERVLQWIPLHKPALQALQRIYHERGQTSALARVLELMLEVEHDTGRRSALLVDLAQQLEAEGQKGMSTIRLEEAMALQPGNLELILKLERLYDPNHPLDLARMLMLHAATEQDTSLRSSIYLRAGDLFGANRMPDKAADAFREAFQCDPGNRELFTRFESLCYEQEQWQELMQLYDSALRFVEREGGKSFRPLDLYVRKGQLQLNHLGQPVEAVASLLLALEQDPKSESVMKLLESIYLQQQDWLGLIRAYEHRANLLPHNELFRLESLRQAARLATGRLPSTSPEPCHLWEAIHAMDPTDEETLDALERIYEEQSLPAKLAALLETRLALTVADEPVVRINLRLAQLCEKVLEDPKRAARALEGVRRVEPHHEESLKSLSRIYEATSMWEQCVEVLKDLVIMEADPSERSLLYFKCGSIMESRFNRDEEAIAYYQAALNETPACLPAIHGLRDIHLRRQDWNSALDTLELEVRLWDEEREQAEVLARMGEIRLNHLGDVRSAIDLFEDALALDAECYAAGAALFDLFFDRGEVRRAMDMGERLVGRMAKEGDLHQRSTFFSRRGQLQAAIGEVGPAVESLVTALDLWSENLEALDWLIALCRRSPEAHDFAAIFRDLEAAYRREENQAAVGHVLVAAGALSEIAGDAETALARCQEAMELVPLDLAPVKSLANLLIRMRRPLEAVGVLEALHRRSDSTQVRVKTLMRVGEIWSDVVPHPGRAMDAYQRVLALDPAHEGAMYRMAQELYLQGALEQARDQLMILMDLTVMGTHPRPAMLAACAHYLGVVLRALGDANGAMKQFRYSLQLDEHHGAAAVALAREMEQMGDVREAKQTLQKVAIGRSVKDRSGNERAAAGSDVLEVRRSLAALHLKTNDVRAAFEEYYRIIQESGKQEDRLALAEIHAARGEVDQARRVIMPVLENDSFNPHALRLLADLHDRSGEQERSLLVLQVMEMLGWVSREERVKLNTLRRQYSIKPLVVLDDGARQYLAAYSGDRHLQRVWEVVSDALERLFPLDLPKDPLQPLNQVGHAEFRQLAEWCVRFVATSANVLVAESVPGGAAVDTVDGGRVVIDRLFLERPAAEVGFVLGRNLEYLRSGHALLSRLAFDDRLLLGELLGGLLQPAESQNDLAQEFRRGVPRRTLKQLDDALADYVAEQDAGGATSQTVRWFAGIDRTANNTGLVACNDISSAMRMVAQLGGQELAVGPRGEIAVQLVTDGPELVQFFLSDRYLKLRRRLGRME